MGHNFNANLSICGGAVIRQDDDAITDGNDPKRDFDDCGGGEEEHNFINANLPISGGRSRSVRSVSFSPDVMRIVSGSDDNTVRVWDAVTGEVISTFMGHGGPVNSVSFSPDGSRIVSGSDDNTVRVWDAVTGEVINTLTDHNNLVP